MLKLLNTLMIIKASSEGSWDALGLSVCLPGMDTRYQAETMPSQLHAFRRR